MRGLLKKLQPSNFAGAVVIGVELFFLLLLFKKDSMAVLFLGFVGVLILICFYPEIGISLAFTGGVILHLLYDYAGIQIPFFALIVSQLSLIFGAAIYFYRNCYGKEIRFGKLFLISVMIGLLLVVGLLFSSNRIYGLTKSVLYLITNVPLFAVILLYRDDHKAVQRILLLNIVFGLVIATMSFIAAREATLFGRMRFHLSENVGPLGVARPLTIATVSSLYFIAVAKSTMKRMLVFGLLPFMILPIMWSGSRGPMIAIFASVLTFVLLQPTLSTRKKSVMFLVFAAFGALFLIYSSNQVSARLAVPITEEASAAFRLLAWIKSFNQFVANPIVGIGTGSFFLKTIAVPLIYPHNLVLELACENGFAGLILILLFAVLTAKYGLAAIKNYYRTKNRRAVQLTICFCALFVNSWLNAMVSGDIYANAFVWISAALVWIMYISSTEMQTTTV